MKNIVCFEFNEDGRLIGAELYIGGDFVKKVFRKHKAYAKYASEREITSHYDEEARTLTKVYGYSDSIPV